MATVCNGAVILINIRLQGLYQPGHIGVSPAPDPACAEEMPEGRRALPGSVAFVPSVAGLIIAGEVIKDLTK